MPRMLWLTMRELATRYSAEKLAPLSATGRKPAVWASRFCTSKSRPARRNRSAAASRWIQPCRRAWLLVGSSRTMSNWALPLEFLTVFQP